MVHIDAAKYLDNEGLKLPKVLQESVLGYIYELHREAREESYFDTHKLQHIYGETYKYLLSFMQELEAINIFVEYDWVGHRREWFFPSYEDALAEEDWHFQCAD
jgi:hypothetical protein